MVLLALMATGGTVKVDVHRPRIESVVIGKRSRNFQKALQDVRSRVGRVLGIQKGLADLRIISTLVNGDDLCDRIGNIARLVFNLI